MKLVFCPFCQDVVRLVHARRSCMCGRVTAWYEDDIKAVVYGKDAVVLGMDNHSLAQAVNVQLKARKEGLQLDCGKDIKAFVISDDSNRIEWVKRDTELDKEKCNG